MSIIRRVANGASALVIACSSLMTLAFPVITHAAGTSCVWTGTAGDSKFNTATNWTGCNGVAPVTGSFITLPYISSSIPVLTNDLPDGTLLGGLIIDSAQGASTNTTDYSIDKLAFDTAAVITHTSGAAVTITDTVTSTGSLTLIGDNEPFVPTTKNITLTPTDLTYITVPSKCYGASAPDFTFEIKPTGLVSVGAGSFYAVAGTEDTIDVAAGGAISVPTGTYAGDITFHGGGATQGTICGTANKYSLNGEWDGDTTLSGTITLAGGDVVYNIVKTLTITGTIEGTGNKLVAYPNSTGTFVNKATVNNSATASGSQVVAMHEITAITDDQSSQNLNVNSNEILNFDGVRKDVDVATKAILKGTGTIKGGLYVNEGGIVAPGHSPGCITSDVTNFAGTYQVELGGADPCSGYDQLKVLNASNGANAVTLDPNAAILTVSLYNSYAPKKGQVFIIVDQAGDKAVTGTFKGLPEGATFTQDGIVYMISYKGGTGNDVTLTVQSVPAVPDTGFSFVSAQPAIILAIMTVLSGAIVFTARRMNAFSTKR